MQLCGDASGGESIETKLCPISFESFYFTQETIRYRVSRNTVELHITFANGTMKTDFDYYVVVVLLKHL